VAPPPYSERRAHIALLAKATQNDEERLSALEEAGVDIERYGKLLVDVGAGRAKACD
jgi:hypothetical protein